MKIKSESRNGMKTAVIILLAPMLTQATLNTNASRGLQKINLSRGEVCYIPDHISKVTDTDLKREQLLCSLDFSVNSAVCGKTESTNPALEIFEIPKGWTAAQVEEKNCNADIKKQAKYKLSTSCSYTPSLLGYYQISRFLGNINQVPVAVLRTVEVEKHKTIAAKTMTLIEDKSSLIAQTWQSLLMFLRQGSASKKYDGLFTSDNQYSYGALQLNPSKEEKYLEIFNGGKDQPSRAENFKTKNATYLRLTDSRSLNSMGMNQWSQASVQEVLRMQNVADMILLDTMLNQADRFGNLHYTLEPYAIVSKKGEIKVDKLDSLSKKDIAAGKSYPQGTLLLKKMMMKDNDCGITKENVVKNAGMLEGLRHFNPETFDKLLKLNKVINTGEGQDFFMRETMMTSSDIANISANITHAVNVLTTACMNGQLTLDLDLDSQFAGAAIPDCRTILNVNQ